MSKDLQVDIFELWWIIVRKRWLVLSSVFLCATGAGLGSLLSPTVYRCQSIIALPGESYRWTTVSEVKELVAAAMAGIRRGQAFPGLSSVDVRKILGITVQEAPESATMFRLVIKTKGDPDLAVRAAEAMFKYLKSDSPIQKRLRIMIQGADSALAYAEMAFQIESRRAAGRYDAALLDLYDRVVEHRIRRASLRNFEYVSPPAMDEGPIASRTWLKITLAAIIGLMAGVVMAVIFDSRR